MKLFYAILFVALIFLASACQRQRTVCPEGSVKYFPSADAIEDSSNAISSEPIATPAMVEIKGKMTAVDRVIRGPICSDAWKGTIYVSCEIEIAEWEDAPLFFEECPLIIEPEAKIYVASHNDTAYYKGCSCHTGELAGQ